MPRLEIAKVELCTNSLSEYPGMRPQNLNSDKVQDVGGCESMENIPKISFLTEFGVCYCVNFEHLFSISYRETGMVRCCLLGDLACKKLGVRILKSILKLLSVHGCKRE